MKRIMMMIGPVAAGKTSLIQRLKGEELRHIKTQALEFDGMTIDTPGEYMENRDYLCALTVTACDADIIVFVQDAVSEELWYSQGQAAMFPSQVIGAVTKIDIASRAQIDFAKGVLKAAGTEAVFELSSVDGTGIEAFLSYIQAQDF